MKRIASEARGLAVLACVMAGVVTPGVSSAQGDSAALVQQGQRLAAQGNCQEAIRYFDRARQANPRNDRAWYELGGCYADLRQYDRAIPALDQAIQLRPSEGVYWGRRSHAKRDKGDFDGALADVDTTLSIDWDNSFAFVIRGAVFLHMGRVRDAQLDFEHARLEVAKRPKIAHWKPQVEHFIKAFLSERPSWTERPQPPPPDAGQGVVRRALDLLKAGQWRRALGYLDVAVARLPGDPELRLSRGLAFYHVHQFARALEDLNEAIRLSPSLAEAFMWRGRVWNYRFEFGQGVEDETRAIQLRANWAEPYYWRARYYQFAYFLDRWQEALRDWDAYLRLEKDPRRLAMAHRFVGSVHFRRGDHPRALPEFQKALELDPKLGVTYCDIAQIARASNQRAQMEQNLAKCRALDPDAGEWYDRDVKTADRVDQVLREAMSKVWTQGSESGYDRHRKWLDASQREEQVNKLWHSGQQAAAARCMEKREGTC